MMKNKRMKIFVALISICLLVACGKKPVASTPTPTIEAKEEITHDIEKAHQVIEAYFDALHVGDFEKAATYCKDEAKKQVESYDATTMIKEQLNLGELDPTVVQMLENAGIQVDEEMHNLALLIMPTHYHRIDVDMNHVMEEEDQLHFYGSYETTDDAPFKEIKEILTGGNAQEIITAKVMENPVLAMRIALMSEEERNKELPGIVLDLLKEEIQKAVNNFDGYFRKNLEFRLRLDNGTYYIIESQEEK